MINLSSTEKQNFNNHTPQNAKLAIYPTTSTVDISPDFVTVIRNQNNDIIGFYVTESNLLSLTIDSYCFSGERIEIGSAIASELSFELDNHDGGFDNVVFEGAEVVVQLKTTADQSYNTYGYFTIDQTPRKRSVISLTALDRMVNFDKDVPTDSNGVWSFVNSGSTVLQYVVNACSNCNVTFNSQGFSRPNSDYVIPEVPNIDATYRQVIQWCAELMGCSAVISESGNLVFKWFSNTNEVLTSENRYSSDIDENSIVITGIKASVDDVDYIYGTDDYAFNIQDNPLLQNSYETVLANLSSLVNFTYTPFSAKVTPRPYLQPLDMATYTDFDNVNHTVIISNVIYSFNATTSIEGKGETTKVNSYARTNSITQQEKTIIKQYVDKVNEKINEQLQAVIDMNNLMANSLGVYRTSEQQADGSYIYYMHDAPLLAESKIVYRFSANGFAWTDNYIGGSTAWSNAITKSGSIIAKTINAEGITVAKGGAENNISSKITPGYFTVLWGEQEVVNVNKEISTFTEVEVEKGLLVGRTKLVPRYDANANLIGTDLIFI